MDGGNLEVNSLRVSAQSLIDIFEGCVMNFLPLFWFQCQPHRLQYYTNTLPKGRLKASSTVNYTTAPVVAGVRLQVFLHHVSPCDIDVGDSTVEAIAMDSTHAKIQT